MTVYDDAPAGDGLTRRRIERWLLLAAGRSLTERERQRLRYEDAERSPGASVAPGIVPRMRAGAPASPQWAKWSVAAGDVEVGAFIGTRHVVSRRQRNRRADLVNVFRVTSGSLILTRDGVDRVYRTGEIGVIRGTRPFTIATPKVAASQSVSLPIEALRHADDVGDDTIDIDPGRLRAALELVSTFLLAKTSGQDFLPSDAALLREVLTPKNTAANADNAWTARVRDEVRALIELSHTSPDLDVAAIAAHVGVSRRQLYRHFPREQGSIGELLTEARLASARALLEDPSLPLQVVAHRSGFRSADTLRRVFLRVHGRPPRSFAAADDL